MKIENYKLKIVPKGAARCSVGRKVWPFSIFNFQFSIFNFQFLLSAVLLSLCRAAVGVTVVLLGGLALCPDTRAEARGTAVAVEPPVAGRPANFSGAIGSRFRVQMRAVPTKLQAEDPLILTVSITGNGSLQEVERPNLRRLPRFAEQFHIENLSERYLPAEKVREFVYRLRPRHSGVKEIPALPFVFFDPRILPPDKGYQTALARALPLTVQPRAKVGPTQVEGTATPIRAPDSVSQFVQGPAVLRHDRAFALPGAPTLAALLLGPPVLGAIWYFVWLRRYPEVARQTNKRRSRAAHQALKALCPLGEMHAAGQARRAGAILAEYLRQRTDLAAAEPTPPEVARHLEQAGSSTALAQEVAHFFANCDAARFAPGVIHGLNSWTATASRLVLALEAEPWPSRMS